MKALYYEAFGQKPDIRTMPDPTPSAHGVVLRVLATGLCRSDWHGWMGHDPDITLPHVPGHELVGIIEAKGKAVENWSVGDRVTVPFVGGCGHCHYCASGDHQVCPDQFQPGFTAWGSFAELVAIDYADTNLVALPETISDASAASLGCRFVTSFRAVLDQGRLSAGEWLVVHGCGGVGLSAIMIGAAAGARIIAVDISSQALDLARSLGAEFTLNAATIDDIPMAIQDLTQGGADLSLDALGSTQTCQNSILGLRRRGRHVQVGLMAGQDSDPAIPMARIIAYELELFGSHGIAAHRYGTLLSMIESGRLAPEKLVTQEISLGDAGVALTQMGTAPPQGVTVITSMTV